MGLQVWLPLSRDLKNVGSNQNIKMTSGSTTSYDDNGVIGRCLTFSGNINSVIYDYDRRTDLNYTDNFSWAMWVNTNFATAGAGAAQYAFTVGRADSGTFGYGFQCTSTSNCIVRFGNKMYDLPVTSGQWTHVAFTKSGTTLKIYKNGELQSTTTFNGTLPSYSASEASGLGIGCFYYSSRQRIYPFFGKINDFRIYDNVLTDSDVRDLYFAKVYQLSPQWKHEDELTALGDVSGVGPLIRQTIGDVTMKGNALYFNGTTSSNITFTGTNTTEGTLSVWFKFDTNPGTGILFLDPVSKMCVGYYNSSYLITSTINQSIYSSTAATANRWNHVAITYNSGKSTDGVWINGVQQTATSTQNYWSAAGTLAAVGLRVRNGAYEYPYKGYINTITEYGRKLSEADILKIYNAGPDNRNWIPSEPTWLMVLHHNAPATNLFTEDNCLDANTENLFSKLKVFINNDSFRCANGKYEFMAKEKLEASSPEQTFRWTQTSNPTALTCTGYELISQTVSAGRNFGISSGNGNTVFCNKDVWWCALGCKVAYSGGIPGFQNPVKTGYLDLYVRADNGVNVVQYLESNGSQYIDTGYMPKTTTEIIVDAALVEVAANTTIVGTYYNTNASTISGRFHFGTYQSKWHFGIGNNASWYNFTSPTPDTSRHTFRMDGSGNCYVDSSTYKLSPGTTIPQSSIGLFCSHRYISQTAADEYVQQPKVRIYSVTIKESGIVVMDIKPCLIDDVGCMYDTISGSILPNLGTGNFTVGL